MKNLKKMSLVVLFAIASALSVNAQEKQQEKLKKHACTEACHKSGKCVFVHGEKKHKCDESCKKTEMKTEVKTDKKA